MNQGFVGWPSAVVPDVFAASRVELLFPRASIQFTNLPLSYTYHNIRLIAQWRSDAAALFAVVNCQFNGDTGTNYDYNSIEWLANGASSAQGAVNATSIQIANMCGGTAPTNAAGQAEVVIANYTSTVFQKTTLSNSHYRTGTATTQVAGDQFNGWWRNTAPITSILLTPSSGNFAAGTTVRLELC